MNRRSFTAIIALLTLGLLFICVGCKKEIPEPSELAMAMKLQDWNEVEKLIRAGVDMTAYDEASREVMHQAIVFRRLPIIQLMIANGYDINVMDADSLTALFRCKSDLDIEVAKFLLENGADINFKTKGGMTPLHWALKDHKGSKGALIDLYLRHGLEVNITDNFKRTALHMAVKGDMDDVVEFLIAKGADVNAMSGIGTPLYIAAGNGNGFIAKVLLEKGANVDKGLGSKTPVHAADKNGHKKILDLLVYHGGKR